MEKALNKSLDEILSKPGVTGVLCGDKNGLCLASKGAVDQKSAGAFVYLARQAMQLEPGKTPVVRLESDTSDVLIQNKNGITLAILKNQR